MSASAPSSSRRRRFALRPVSSVVGTVALFMAAFVLGPLLAAAAWVAISTRSDRTSDASERVQVASQTLGPTMAMAIRSGDLQAARDMLPALARAYGLDHARVVLPDQTVLADSDPAAITTRALPPEGSSAWMNAPAPSRRITSESVREVVAIDLDGRKQVLLELRKDIASGAVLGRDAIAGLGIVAAAGIMLYALGFRWIHLRLRAIGAIRESLSALGAGERQTEALKVGELLGPEARPWNQLLAERDQWHAHLLAEQTRESVSKRLGGSGHLAQACDALWHGVVTIDDKRRVTYANPAAAVFLGERREKLAEGDVGTHLRDQRVLNEIHAVLAGRVRRRISVEVRRPEGPGAGVLRYTIRPIGKDDAAGVLIFIEDVTQQRIADESRNSFVAQATHELRTPLTNIRLYVEQAIEAGESDPKTRTSALNVINQETIRLERVVSDMLSVSEIEAGSLKLRQDDVRLDQLLQDAKSEFTPQAQEKGIALGFELAPKLPVTLGDRDKIAQAIHNLLGNAIKYTPRGGIVQVKADSTPDRVFIEVADTGIGIAPDEVERVFEKFYRSKDQRVSEITGTGLGLPLAREVARLHGGDITVKSELNRGSTFTLVLPIQAPAAIAA